METIFAGIDVAKYHLDLCCLPCGKCKRFENNKNGIGKMIKYLSISRPRLTVMEATGGYEACLVEAFQKAQIPMAVVNPKRIRDFAKAKGQLAKTDKLDAAVIASFASAIQPPAQVLDPNSAVLKTLITRRYQLDRMKTQEINRQEHDKDKFVKKSLKRILAAIEREIKRVDQQINSHVAKRPELKAKAQILISAPGVGHKTATMLITKVPEIGRLNRRQLAMLTGVAPINRDSGTFRGKRMTGAGRRNVKNHLYMPTLVAIQHNPVIHKFYQRLLARGKTKMTAVVACIRKLLTILNSMVANNETWNNNLA